jgi:hypothetical protein
MRSKPFLAMVLLGACAGCANSSSSTGYTPFTEIQIPGDTVVAGHGCGPGPNQVYKYAVVVSYAGEAGPVQPPIASGVFECFADGVFSNLVADASLETFYVEVFAYNQQSFPQQALDCSRPNPPTAFPCPGDDAGAILRWESSANWTMTCTAGELQGTPAVAVCGMLEPTDAGTTGAAGGDESDAAPEDAADAADAGSTQ